MLWALSGGTITENPSDRGPKLAWTQTQTQMQMQTQIQAQVQTTMQACADTDDSHRHRQTHAQDSETDMVEDTDMHAGTRRATHVMMLQCFPALPASISRRAPDQV